MARHSQQPIRTYAIGFSPAAKRRRCTTSCPTRAGSPNCFPPASRDPRSPDVVALLPKLLWHMDEPLSDTAFITTFLVSEFAREDVKVILSGVGGDELFGGYRRYLGGHYARRYRRCRNGCAFCRLCCRTPAGRPSFRSAQHLRLAKGFWRQPK
jgi:asparagine synthase (glutamine-hydrolysing)